MALAYSKVTAQGQISVPAGVRRRLGIVPGSILEWEEDGENVVVRRSARFTSEDVHRALFPKQAPKPRILEDMKEGIRRHAGNVMRAVDTNVLVRLITRDDVRQNASADAFIGKGAWVSILALAEATWILAAVYERNPTDLAAAIDKLMNHRDLTLQDADVVAALADRLKGGGIRPGGRS